jgi:cobalt-precorrin 5A hydrolase
MRTAILVLSPTGLALAQRLFAGRPDATAIFGPSCIVGACGGPAVAAAPDAPADTLPPGTFAAAEPGTFGFTGPLRKVFPALWSRFEAIVAVMPLANLVHLAGPLAGHKRLGPTVVVVDDAGRFAVSVLDGRGTRADDLAHQVAATLGAVPVVTSSRGRSVAHDVGRR